MDANCHSVHTKVARNRQHDKDDNTKQPETAGKQAIVQMGSAKTK